MKYSKYSDTKDIPWYNNQEPDALVMLLVEHFDLSVEVATYNQPNTKYLLAESLSEIEYIDDSESSLGEINLTIHRSSSNFSYVDPDCNPMGFVVEFSFKDGPTRWLEVYGHYVSHDGGYYDGWREVQPKTVTVSVFEEV